MNRRLLIIIGSSAIIVLAVIAVLVTRSGSLSKSAHRQPADSSPSLLNQARELVDKNRLLEAKYLYQRLIAEYANSSKVMDWQKELEQINIKLLFSPIVTPKSTMYQIEPGDNLTKIAKKFGTTVELIMKSNGMADDKIMPGRKIKVWSAPFNILVDKSQNVLILKSDEDLIKTYIASTGKDNSSPVGKFKITSKLKDPAWFKEGAVVPADSPENILGSRWLGFDLAGYGIHGTTDPESLGKQVTQGCLRLSNTDVEELYAIVPVGAEVTIVD